MCALCGPDGEHFKQPGLANDVYNDHHPDEEKHDVVVHPEFMGVKGLVLGDHAQPDHEGGAAEGNDGLMNPLRDDDQIGEAKDRKGK